MKRLIVFALAALVFFALLLSWRRERTPSSGDDRGAVVQPSPPARDRPARLPADATPPPATPAPAGVFIRARDSESGKPVGGVRLSWLGRHTVMPASGQVRLPPLPSRTRIAATCPGYEPISILTSGAGVEELLLMPAKLDICLLDGNSLQPLSGVKLTVGGKPVATSHGMASLPLPLRKGTRITARLPGYLDCERRLAVGPQARMLELRLIPVRVEGEVHDADSGAPIAGATVKLLNASARTGEGGAFEFSGLPGMERLARKAPPPITLEVGKPGYATTRIAVPRLRRRASPPLPPGTAPATAPAEAPPAMDGTGILLLVELHRLAGK